MVKIEMMELVESGKKKGFIFMELDIGNKAKRSDILFELTFYEFYFPVWV